MIARNLFWAVGTAALLACGAKEKPPADVALTEANVPGLVSMVWADNAATDPSDVLNEAGPLLDKQLPVVALQPNGATTDVPCLAAGSVSLVGQVADPRRPGWTAGDRVTATFAACRDSTHAWADTTSGAITLELTAVAAGSRTFTVAYDAFATSVPEFGTFTVNGTVTITLATDGDLTSVTADAARFTGAGGGAQETVLDKHVKLVDHGSTRDAAYSLEFSARAISSRWSGAALRYETPVAFTGTGTGFPAAGQLLLRGAGGASARLTAVDAATVRLELDLDGDGAVDPGLGRTLTWLQVDDPDFGYSP